MECRSGKVRLGILVKECQRIEQLGILMVQSVSDHEGSLQKVAAEEGADLNRP